MSIVLHGYWRSSATWRVRLGLALKGLSWETRPVHLVRDGGEQHSAAYRALNPMREVPTLDIDGHVLTQSMAILEYLEETRPEPPFLPKAPADRAHVRRLAEGINAGIQPVQNLRILQSLTERFQADDAAKAAWARNWITRGFEGLEPLMASDAGTYAFGDHPGLADILLAPQVYNAERFKVDMAPFPTIARVHANLREHPVFEAARPEHQADAPTVE